MLPNRALRYGLAVLLLLFGTLIAGCAARIGDFTLASTKNIGQLSQIGETVEGEDCASFLLFIPLQGTMVPNFKTAVDKALERAKGDVLADAVMWQSQISTILFNQLCYKVEGKAARAALGKK